MKYSSNKMSLPALAVLSFASSIFIGTSQAALWTPAETATALWFDASDASTITEAAGEVSQWNDKSGNARNATQGTGAAQPDTGGTHNGLNVINFDGATEFFSLGTGLDWMGGGGGNATHTAFMLLNSSLLTDIYGAANPSAGDASLHIGFGSATTYRMNRWGNDFGTAITVNFVAGEFNMLRFTWVEGGAKSVYANTLLEGQSAPTHASSLSAMAGGGQLGKVVNHGFLGADIGEFLIVDGVPDADTTDRIEGYMAWKWGEEGKLPVGHAYEDAAPLTLIPEPSTAALFGLAGLGLVRRRRR